MKKISDRERINFVERHVRGLLPVRYRYFELRGQDISIFATHFDDTHRGLRAAIDAAIRSSRRRKSKGAK